MLAGKPKKIEIEKDDVIGEQSVVDENGEKEEKKEDEEVTRKRKRGCEASSLS